MRASVKHEDRSDSTHLSKVLADLWARDKIAPGADYLGFRRLTRIVSFCGVLETEFHVPRKRDWACRLCNASCFDWSSRVHAHSDSTRYFALEVCGKRADMTIQATASESEHEFSPKAQSILTFFRHVVPHRHGPDERRPRTRDAPAATSSCRGLY